MVSMTITNKKSWLILLVLFVTLASSSFAFSKDQPLGNGQDIVTLNKIIETIDDEEKREQFLQKLEGIKKRLVESGKSEQFSSREVKDIEYVARPLANWHFLDEAQKQTDRFLRALASVGSNISQIADFPDWLIEQFGQEKNRMFWLELALLGVGFPIIVALIAKWVVNSLFAATIKRLRNAELDTLQDRVFKGTVRTLLDAVGVAAVLVAGYTMLGIVPRSPYSVEIAQLLINAIAVIAGAGVIARALLAPHADQLRIIPVTASTSAYLYIWFRRLSVVGVAGYALSKIATLTASAEITIVIEVLSVLVFALLLTILVLQNREAVALSIRGNNNSQIRARLADIWHVFALIYIFLVFCIFGFGAQSGFLFLVKSTSLTILAVFVGVIFSLGSKRLIDRVFKIDPELNSRFPGLLERSSLYRPILRKIVDGILTIAVILSVFAAWDIDFFAIVSPEARGKIVSGVGTILIVLIFCVVAWEFSSSYIAKILARSEERSSIGRAGSRGRTLLPLLRRAILIALIVFGGLIILAEIGVDIAPLMAGAGVIGLAIGFGSQALVRDIITGLFILIEDTIAVGDVVTVGGHTGLVEDLSIRTIRLRDVAGTVHTVPFGDVTSVENLTKDFSYALLDIGIAYREDTDTVSQILKEICEELQGDENWGTKILEPIQVMGVQELADSAVIIRSRIKTVPIMQWAVKREFLGRVKKRFDQEGIELPFPHTTLYFGEDKEGSAPPAHVIIGEGS